MLQCATDGRSLKAQLHQISTGNFQVFDAKRVVLVGYHQGIYERRKIRMGSREDLQGGPEALQKVREPVVQDSAQLEQSLAIGISRMVPGWFHGFIPEF